MAKPVNISIRWKIIFCAITFAGRHVLSRVYIYAARNDFFFSLHSMHVLKPIKCFGFMPLSQNTLGPKQLFRMKDIVKKI